MKRLLMTTSDPAPFRHQNAHKPFGIPPTMLTFCILVFMHVQFTAAHNIRRLDECFPFCSDDRSDDGGSDDNLFRIPGSIATEAELIAALKQGESPLLITADIALTREVEINQSVVLNSLGSTFSGEGLSNNRCMSVRGRNTNAVFNGISFSQCTNLDESTGPGGALLVHDGASLVFNSPKVSESFSSSGGGVAVINGASLVMNAGSIENCKASRLGGGFMVDRGGEVVMNSMKVSACRAAVGGGGAVVGDTSSAVFNIPVITSNEASEGAGALFIRDAGVRANSGLFKANSAPVCGGLAVSGSGKTSLYFSEVDGNGESTEDEEALQFVGGGICVSERGTVNLVASKVQRNRGGDVFLGGSAATLAVFSACGKEAFYDGGANVSSMVCGQRFEEDQLREASYSYSVGGDFLYSYSYTSVDNGLVPSRSVSTSDCAESFISDLLTGTYPGLCEDCSGACCGATACKEDTVTENSCTVTEREIC